MNRFNALNEIKAALECYIEDCVSSMPEEIEKIEKAFEVIKKASNWDELKWSGDCAIPEVGEIINVTVNGIGEAEVLGYGHADGFLYCTVKVLDPPAWYVRQNGDDRISNIFGAEMEVMDV